MWALVIGLMIAGGLVKFAYDQKEEPTVRPALRKARLIRIAKIPEESMTLDQSEDGMVLAREFDAPELGKRFARIASRLKAARRKK